MNEDRIIQLKAELFDLQVELGRTKLQVEEKLKELNSLLKEKNESVRVD